MTLQVGIDKISFYVPPYYVEMEALAKARQVEVEKFTIGIGQDEMAVVTAEHDIVAMAANAAEKILTDDDRASIDQIIVATESSFDFSKAVSTYLHHLLKIQPFAKAYEVKEACFAGIAALEIGCNYIRQHPTRKVLVVTTDISRYGLNTSGEVTQGAGAVAFLLSANPRIISFSTESVSYTTHAFDFWRPVALDVALVDGKFSTELYKDLFIKIAQRFEEKNSELFKKIETIVFHLPFSKMGQKTLEAYHDDTTTSLTQAEKTNLINRWLTHYPASIQLSKRIGNIYTGAIFLSLLSLLAYDDTLEDGDEIGLFSYGSGAVGELLVGTLVEGFKETLEKDELEKILAERIVIDIPTYEAFFQSAIPQEAENYILPLQERTQTPGFYLEKIKNFQRFYSYRKK